MPRLKRNLIRENKFLHIMVQGINRERIFKKDNQKNLGKLGRLEISKSQINPPSGTVHIDSDSRNQNDSKKKYCQSVNQPVKVQNPDIINQ